jgi:hypothetical protein
MGCMAWIHGYTTIVTRCRVKQISMSDMTVKRCAKNILSSSLEFLSNSGDNFTVFPGKNGPISLTTMHDTIIDVCHEKANEKARSIRSEIHQIRSKFE